jgi:ComF family protein
MSISLALRRVISALLPQDCLLCAAPGGGGLLCPACLADLPMLASPRCPVCAAPTPNGNVCGACLKSPPAFDATVAVWRYGFPVDRLIQALKFEHRLAIAGFFAQAMASGLRPTADLIIPVPLSDARLKERGFNQAVEIARPLARATAVPLDLAACRRTEATAPQSRLPWKERRRNVRNAFQCGLDLTGRSVIVVDDVMTTGATLDEVARTLKHHGAAKVTNWVVARALRDD